MKAKWVSTAPQGTTEATEGEAELRSRLPKRGGAPRMEASADRGGGGGGGWIKGISRGLTITFALTYVCYATIYFTRKPYSVVKKSVGEDLKLSKAELGMIDTAFLSMYAVGQFTLSPLGDLYGPRRVLSACFAVSSLVSIVFARSSNHWTLLGLMGLNGLVQALLFPLCVKALNPWLPSRMRGFALGVWTTSQQVGGVLSTALAGYLATGGRWRQAIELPAYVVAVSSAALYFLLLDAPSRPSSPPVAPPSPASSPNRAQTTGEASAAAGAGPTEVRGDGKAEKPGGGSGRFFEALAIPGLINLGGSYFFIKLARYTLMFWLPFYLGEEHGYPEADAAYLSTLFDLGGVVGSLACGYVSDKALRGNRLLAVGPCCITTGLLLLIYPLVSSWGSFTNCLMLFLIGFFIAGPDSVLGGAATADACERHGAFRLLTTAGGISNGMGSLGSMIQGPVSSAAVAGYGWAGLFRLLGSLCICGSAMLAPQMADEYRRLQAARR
eukprot:m.289300 g.289300  ORF g.289300 m.289300 type:complete len:498 (-) comp16224_c0_seq5:689-2182(-)